MKKDGGIDSKALTTVQESFDLLNKNERWEDYGQSSDISHIVEKVKSLIGGKEAAIPEESKFDQSHFADLDIDPTISKSVDSEDDTDKKKHQLRKKSNVLSGNQIKVNSETPW